MDTIPAVLRAAAAATPDREAVVTPEVRLTFAELLDRSQTFSRAALASGLQPGDRVAMWGPNTAAWVVAGLGLSSIGVILVPVNTRFKGEEARYLLDRTKVSALFVDDGFLTELLGADPVLALGNPDVQVIRTSQLDAFLQGASEVEVDTVEKAADAVLESDPSDIIFTSGTTGKPKGAVATHGQSIGIFRTWALTVGLREGERMLVIAPFFHTFGYKAGLLACLLQRATCVPMKVFDVDEAVRTIIAEKIDVIPGPPTVYSSLLEHPSQLPPIRLAVTGAAVVPTALIARMRQELGFQEVITAYGLTECCGVATACRQGDPDEIISLTSGRAVDGVEVRVLAETGQPGEVLVRGYGVMTGYWDDPEATAEAIDSDGWLHTGDIGVMDEAGNLRITDRLKDMYVVGGFNAYPAEIEQVLVRHEGVSEAAVIGVPDERMGEVGKAFVVPRTGADVTPEAVVDWCRERLANYKVPRYVEIVDSLPRNATGKVTKNDLRNQ
ncbi:MAG: Long-chain-fatty-acid--CoA ligase [Frankiales bacterium]|nr:Long-chain-fatty-acid--CoA ligase [Frankiales bacterium]